MPKRKDAFSIIADIAIATLAILALRSLFRDDSSHIISEEGQKVLEDQDKLNKIKRKITDQTSHISEVVLDLD